MLDQDSENILCKLSESKYLRLCRPYVFCPNYSTQLLQCKSSQTIHKQNSINKTLFTKTGSDWIWLKGGSLLTPILDITSKEIFKVTYLSKKSINFKWYLVTTAVTHKPDTLSHL